MSTASPSAGLPVAVWARQQRGLCLRSISHPDNAHMEQHQQQKGCLIAPQFFAVSIKPSVAAAAAAAAASRTYHQDTALCIFLPASRVTSFWPSRRTAGLTIQILHALPAQDGLCPKDHVWSLDPVQWLLNQVLARVCSCACSLSKSCNRSREQQLADFPE